MYDQVPDHWTGEHAVNFVAFLESVRDAVWARHGPNMIAVLRRQGEDALLVDIPGHFLDPLPDDQIDFPF